MPTDELSSASTSSFPSFAVGHKLAGVYVLRNQISDDPEGAIWVAHDEVLGKDVSLHFIPNLLRHDERAMGEIRQEIKRNRQLIHPGILRVYDLVEEPDWSAISMDWFEGESLAAALKAKPGGFFEPADVKAWLQQVCHTVDDIHKIQIFHRDLGPHNIFVDGKGKVLVAKFGIGRVMQDALARLNQGAPDARLAALSPQCLDGENPSKADDVYSIGATIYELLTGELPFVGAELVTQIRKSPPQPMMDRRAKLGKKGGTILPVWEKWVAAALAKPSTERPASAGELATKLGLTGKLTAEPLAAVTPPPAAATPAKTAAAPAAPAPAPAATPAPASVAAMAPAKTEPVTATKTAPATGQAPVGSPKEPEKKPAAETAAVAASSIAAIAAATTPEASAKNTAAETTPASKGKSDKTAAGEPAKSADAEKMPEIKLPAAPLAASASKVTETPEFIAAKTAGAALEKKPAQTEIEAPAGGKKTSYDDEYAERPVSSRTSTLVFGGLILIVAGLAYFLNRPDEADGVPKKPAAPVNAAVSPVPATPVHSAATPGSTPAIAHATAPPRMAEATPTHPPALAGATPARPPATPGSTPSVAPSVAGLLPPPTFTGDTEKDYASAVKFQKDADNAVAEIDGKVKKLGVEIAPLMKSAEQLQKDRTDRAAQVKMAEDAATAARQAAEAKAKAVEDTKKALSDWEATNAPKLASLDKASAEMRTLQESVEPRKKQAADAAKAVAAADQARQQHAMVLKQKEEADRKAEAEKKAAELAKNKEAEDKMRRDKEVADERARRIKEQADQAAAIQAQIEELQRKMKIITEGTNATDPAGTSAVPPRVPATPSSTPPRPPATPGVSSTPPRPLPSPTPIKRVEVQGELRGLANEVPSATPMIVANVPSTPLRYISSTPPPVLPPPDASSLTKLPAPATPVPTPPAPAPAGVAAELAPGESSLGLKFAPVGDVAFCVWPTRVQDFEVFAKETGFRGNSWRSPGFKQGLDHPVVNVSWNDAIAFCKWLTERDRKKGALTREQSYRLPTDLEFSRAIGLTEEIGKSPKERDMALADVYPWGTQWPPPPKAGNYTGEETGSDVAIKGFEDDFVWTSPVGSFPPNQYGLYDVGGNVWQWCMDNFAPDDKSKVLRGASWYNGALRLSLLSSCRVHSQPEYSADTSGFRIVRITEGGKTARAAVR